VTTSITNHLQSNTQAKGRIEKQKEEDEKHRSGGGGLKWKKMKRKWE
jgi:hypothetical protein